MNHHPHHPIIYVRGFAMTPGEIEEAVAEPYMGFNAGSTKSRQDWNGEPRRFFFESPIVRLNTDHGYDDDTFAHGQDVLEPKTNDATRPLRDDFALPYRTVAVYRYYDEASKAFGDGETPTIEHFARGLGLLILRLREAVCRKEKHPITGAPVDNGVAPDEFRVHLVAHSMGGLICRAFLQNPALVDEIPGLSAGQKAAYEQARLAVDKLFTYATPHNGIDLRLVGNVPAWAQKFDLDNFNRKRIGEYLGLTQKGDSALKDVAVVKNFSPERVFNLVGTNPQDYTVAGGISSWAAGEASDGLVRVANATTHGTGEYGERIESPRAFVHRSHSGHYGIVNSEEGYQNLTRFLFGNVRVDGVLLVDEITLPDDVQKQKDAGKTVRASYQFEVVASVRGSQWNIHRRMVRENSAIFRTYDELFPKPAGGARKPDRTASPHLFSVFLDQSKSRQTDKPVEERSISMAFDLSVLVPDYEVDGLLFLDRHYEGGHIYRDRIILEAFPDDATPGGWKMKYGFQSKTPNQANKIADVEALPKKGGVAFEIEIEQKKHPGIHARLRIEARHWNT